MNTLNTARIICPECKKYFEISDALKHQFNDELQKEKTKQTEAMRQEYEAQTAEKIQTALDEAAKSAKRSQEEERKQAAMKLEDAEREIARAKQATELAVQKANKATELELERLRAEAKSEKESTQQLRKELKDTLAELLKANKDRENAEIEAGKKLKDKENTIREEATERANEVNHTKIREQEETIRKLNEQLTAAKQTAEQGSQQQQGEILELDIENRLRTNFPSDTITEVKKGERGSDIHQSVNAIANGQIYQDCGLILWECKNAKNFQGGWVSKLKDELADKKAHIGVIVFNSIVDGGQDLEQLEENIWVVKPRYATMLAQLLRDACIRVAIANRNAENKDVKVEMLYNYLTGNEFANRMRYILETYEDMAKQLKIERNQAEKRWAAQEKNLQKVMASLHGMSGDLHVIAGQEIIALSVIDDEK